MNFGKLISNFVGGLFGQKKKQPQKPVPKPAPQPVQQAPRLIQPQKPAVTTAPKLNLAAFNKAYSGFISPTQNVQGALNQQIKAYVPPKPVSTPQPMAAPHLSAPGVAQVRPVAAPTPVPHFTYNQRIASKFAQPNSPTSNIIAALPHPVQDVIHTVSNIKIPQAPGITGGVNDRKTPVTFGQVVKQLPAAFGEATGITPTIKTASTKGIVPAAQEFVQGAIHTVGQLPGTVAATIAGRPVNVPVLGKYAPIGQQIKEQGLLPTIGQTAISAAALVDPAMKIGKVGVKEVKAGLPAMQNSAGAVDFNAKINGKDVHPEVTPTSPKISTPDYINQMSQAQKDAAKTPTRLWPYRSLLVLV